MATPPTCPADERERLGALAATGALEAPDGGPFEDIASLAAQLCQTPMAAVSLIDADRQWFKARVGLPVDSTSREHSFCAHGIASHAPMIVEDAHRDPRFADNPLVLGDPNIRFYAGVPLAISEGSALGMLCVIDRVPRSLSDKQVEGLRTLARHIARELRLRHALASERAQRDVGEAPVREGDVVGGRWELGPRLGQGGVGLVFEARGPKGERGALKLLLPRWVSHAEVVERFAREARLLMTIDSPHLTRVLDVGNLEGRAGPPYVVMQYLEGTDLDRLIEQRGKVSWREAVGWTIEACEGLETVHSLGVVHRDLKPSNLFLSLDERGEGRVKLLDFGIAKGELSPAHAPITQVGSVLGTLHYMPPEQMTCSNDVDARSDIWALGVMLYEMVAGRRPFEGNTGVEVCRAVMTRPPVPLRAVERSAPFALEGIVRQCLQRDRELRFASAGELAEALRGVLEGAA